MVIKHGATSIRKPRDEEAQNRRKLSRVLVRNCTAEQLRQQRAIAQKDLLREAMQELLPLVPTRERFAELIGVSKRGLDKWLVDYDPGKSRSRQEFREMPEPIRRLIIVMLENPGVVKQMQVLVHEHKRRLQAKT